MSKAVTIAQPVPTQQELLGSRVVMPTVSAEEALEAWRAYQDLKNKIIDPKTDIQVIRNQEFKKKSYWRKVATFFNLSLETRDEWKEQLGRTLVWHFVVRAQAPNGRFVDGVGSCDVFEKAILRDGKYQTYNAYKSKWEEAVPNSPHNIRSTAYTRAFNRAVSDLVAGGEVSAEEVQAHQEANYRGQQPATERVIERRMAAALPVSSFPDPTEKPSARPATTPSLEPKTSGQYQCEKCEETIPLNAMLKSKERYDEHTFCFKHQLAYKHLQVQQRAADSSATRQGTNKAKRVPVAA